MDSHIDLHVGNAGERDYYRINTANGDVMEQHRWHGDPMSLVGFTAHTSETRAALAWGEYTADPSLAVGMHPVFLRGSDGKVYALEKVVVEPKSLALS